MTDNGESSTGCLVSDGGAAHWRQKSAALELRTLAQGQRVILLFSEAGSLTPPS
jgi:hypothetical protein